MSIEHITRTTIVFQCDRCFTNIDFHAEEGHPTADMVACLGLAKEIGWKSDKHVGYAWEHYCPECAVLPASERYPRTKPDPTDD